MICLYEATVDDIIRAFMQIAKYRTWLKRGSDGKGFDSASLIFSSCTLNPCTVIIFEFIIYMLPLTAHVVLLTAHVLLLTAHCSLLIAHKIASLVEVVETWKWTVP
jgi:hypothetical protein